MASEASKIDRRFTLRHVANLSILYAMSLAWMRYGSPGLSFAGLLIFVTIVGGTIGFLVGGRAAVVDGICFVILLIFLVTMLLPAVH